MNIKHVNLLLGDLSSEIPLNAFSKAVNNIVSLGLDKIGEDVTYSLSSCVDGSLDPLGIYRNGINVYYHSSGQVCLEFISSKSAYVTSTVRSVEQSSSGFVINTLNSTYLLNKVEDL